jgi:hypothetical protein
MRAAKCVGLLILVLSLAPSTSAQTEWLPKEVAEAMAQQLGASIRAVDVEGKVAPGDELTGARKGIADMVARIDALGVDGVMQMAPEFSGIELPPSGQPHFDAIARYGVCSFSLDAVYSDDSIREDALGQRVSAAVMSMSIPVISAFLRHHYLAAGATDEEAKDYLAGEALNAISAQIQTSPELLQSTMNQCALPLSQLLE